MNDSLQNIFFEGNMPLSGKSLVLNLYFSLQFIYSSFNSLHTSLLEVLVVNISMFTFNKNLNYFAQIIVLL